MNSTKIVKKSTIKNDDITREDKIKALNINEKLLKNDLEDELINQLYNEFCVSKSDKVTTKKQVDKNSSKYKLTLEFLNELMLGMGKNKIDDILDFKDIKKDDLLSDECNKIMDQYMDKFIDEFGKTKLLYRKKESINNYILTLLRKIISDIGLTFYGKRKTGIKKTNDGQYLHLYTYFYHIR